MSRAKIPVTAEEVRQMQDGLVVLSESELLALEQQHDMMIDAGKRVRNHLKNCEHSDMQTLDAVDTLLRYIGIYDQVVKPEVATQPQAEMACHDDDWATDQVLHEDRMYNRGD